MSLHFFKYQGTGNDFIMIDGREKNDIFSVREIQRLCDRRFGIGADGLIMIKTHEACDFEMDYYNADGTQSFCGNGSRCAQAFAKKLGIIGDSSYFLAIDGYHHGKSEGSEFATKMGDVKKVDLKGEDYFVDTGSPHYISYVDDVFSTDVFSEGQKIRNREEYKEQGTNVNFVSIIDNDLAVRTYERGVEDETLSCGTGVTAAAISFVYRNKEERELVKVKTRGGELRIALRRTGEQSFEDIWLIGPAEEVFEGKF